MVYLWVRASLPVYRDLTLRPVTVPFRLTYLRSVLIKLTRTHFDGVAMPILDIGKNVFWGFGLICNTEYWCISSRKYDQAHHTTLRLFKSLGCLLSTSYVWNQILWTVFRVLSVLSLMKIIYLNVYDQVGTTWFNGGKRAELLVVSCEVWAFSPFRTYNPFIFNIDVVTLWWEGLVVTCRLPGQARNSHQGD